MKRFIVRLSMFLAVVLIAVALFTLLLLHPRNRLIALGDDVYGVFLGNSTVECGINDLMIPGTFNFARSAERIEYVYAKLKILKKYNPSINTAFVQFDDIIIGHTSAKTPHSHPIFIDAFSLRDIANNIKTFSFDRNAAYICHTYDVKNIRYLISANFREVNISQMQIGGYRYLIRDKLAENIEILEKDSDKQTTPPLKFPMSNLYYYKAIVEFCQKNEIKLYFITTPRHPIYWRDSSYKHLKIEYFPDIPMIDYSHMQLPDSCFGDGVHLNYIGARIFSDSLATVIEGL